MVCRIYKSTSKWLIMDMGDNKSVKIDISGKWVISHFTIWYIYLP